MGSPIHWMLLLHVSVQRAGGALWHLLSGLQDELQELQEGDPNLKGAMDILKFCLRGQSSSLLRQGGGTPRTSLDPPPPFHLCTPLRDAWLPISASGSHSHPL